MSFLEVTLIIEFQAIKALNFLSTSGITKKIRRLTNFSFKKLLFYLTSN